jgi:hypothetical protein
MASWLIDVWDEVPPRLVYTHYTPHGAARLDRIYITDKLSDQKLGAGCPTSTQRPGIMEDELRRS